MISAFPECRCKRVDNVVAEDVTNAQLSLWRKSIAELQLCSFRMEKRPRISRPENCARMSRLVLSYRGLGSVVVGSSRRSH